jgi:hypothetical protein
MAQRGHKEKEHCVGRVCNGDVGDMTVGQVVSVYDGRYVRYLEIVHSGKLGLGRANEKSIV